MNVVALLRTRIDELAKFAQDLKEGNSSLKQECEKLKDLLTASAATKEYTELAIQEVEQEKKHAQVLIQEMIDSIDALLAS